MSPTLPVICGSIDISSSTSIKPYALEEACTVWEGVRLIPKNCSATVKQVGNVVVNQKSLGRAGSKRWLGKRPVDHPHGGCEGRAPIGRKKPLTPWGYRALGRRSRKRNKYSDNLILRRRSK
ncbi:hypothetical protein F8388_019801 [Cannabis sativa]|uniref:Large ribosomal subunit protein uL2 C-terminal domain-containing protein n=1 Tax=Cannabis sativa TaxID=3483 RepID=A0A7J6HMN9_CANSA|nr:hypothetical protein F8388_019801 [Cannabis sativa]